MKRKRKTTTTNGRPSMAEIQKRALRSTKVQQSPSIPTTSPRRSSRRNPNPEVRIAGQSGGGRRNGVGMDRGRRRKKRKQLKQVLKKSSEDQASAAEEEEEEEQDATEYSKKKRRIEEIGGIATGEDEDEAEKMAVSGSSALAGNTHQESHLDSGPLNPLPDKKILLYILDRLQKKDSYGVFSEPVDPEELPDYDEVIEHPMDFGTVRKKLDSGAYVNLEQFEVLEAEKYCYGPGYSIVAFCPRVTPAAFEMKDIFLISFNAMQYNAPSTIYFRQARAIEELAKSNFAELRQCGDGSGTTFKIIRRGRPPKSLKTVGEPAVNGVVLRPSSHATLATDGANVISTNCDRRNMDIYGSTNSFGRLCHGPRSNDIYASTFLEKRFDRNDEYSSSHLKEPSIKPGKIQVALGDSRRCTYDQFNPSTCGREAFLFAFFQRDRKQFVPVGLQAPHSYARSLARFAANLGPVAWKVASSKIEKSLPAGVKFGPGWVGQNDVQPKLAGELPISLDGPPPLYPSSNPQASASRISQIVIAADEHSNVRESRAEEMQNDRVQGSPSEFNVSNSSACIVPASPFVHSQLKFMRSGVDGVNGLLKSGLTANVRQLIGAPGSSSTSELICIAESGSASHINPVMGDSSEYNPLPDAVSAASDRGS